MNHIGVCEWTLPVNGPYAVAYAAKCGFEGIQLGDLGGDTMSFPMNDKLIQEGYLEAALKNGMVLHSMHLHELVRTGGIVHPRTSPLGERATRSLEASIDACAQMGIPCVNISAFFASEIKNTYCLRNFIDHVRFAVQYGMDKNVAVAYEPILGAEKTLAILEAVPGLRLNFDTLNPIFGGSGDPRGELKAYGIEVIDHVHVKDAPEDFSCNCTLGEGAGELAKTVGLLKEMGYSGWYLSENYDPGFDARYKPDFPALEKRDIAALKKLHV